VPSPRTLSHRASTGPPLKPLGLYRQARGREAFSATHVPFGFVFRQPQSVVSTK
jgi:hypothetical protein